MANGITAQRWKALLDKVRKEQPDLYQPWFASLQAGTLAGGTLTVDARDSEKAYYLDSSCRRAFAEAAQAILGRLVAVEFVDPTAGTDAQPGLTTPARELPPDEPIKLSPTYVFENFVVGPGNRLAHAASIAVAENPGMSYNPLFIHGSVGLGKTHLLQAICHGVLAHKPDARIYYFSCDSFINHFITALAQNAVHAFRSRCRHVDLLVIDDVHFLTGEREHTQEEFFHTFNTLYQAQKQIVLSSDCPPSEIPDLQDRLVSRFNWGLVARIDAPSYETRVAITRRKARQRGLDLPEEVCSFIAAKVQSNIREIEGAITRVQMQAQVEGTDPSLELARAALDGPPEAAPDREVSVQQIMDAVMVRFNVRLADLQSKKRSRSIAFPRQICMYLARKLTRHSLGEIGGYFGGRDHTTVLHACRTIEEAIANDARLEATIGQLAEGCRNNGAT